MAIGGLTGGLAATAGLVAGVGDVKAGPPRSLLDEMSNSVAAQAAVAPGQLSAEQTFQPQYSKLALDQLGSTIGGNGGLLSIIQSIMPAINQLTTQQRGQQISDINTLGPGVMDAWRKANPTQANLLDQITKGASTNLSYGTSLDPATARNLSQNFRAGQAARGLGTGTGDAGLEAFYQQQAGQSMYQQRLANATNAAQTWSQNSPDPFSFLMGIGGPANASSLFTGAGAVNGSAGPKLFPTMNSYESDLFNTNYNADAAARISSANNSAAILGAGIGAGKGSTGQAFKGGGGGGGGMC